MTHRSRVLLSKRPRQEQELRILSNPTDQASTKLLKIDDYQAPFTSGILSPQSKWLLVRRNLHKIRSWVPPKQLDNVDPRCQDWYIYFQMRRELRRAQEDIKTIQSRPDFVPVRYFKLPTDEEHTRRYDVSHVQAKDALYYPSFGPEPIVLQSLLYYFTRECAVPYESIFLAFLANVCSIIDQDRIRLNRVVVLRRVALIVAIIVFAFLGMMFLSMLFGALTTTSNLRQMYLNDPDGGAEWKAAQQSLEANLNSLSR